MPKKSGSTRGFRSKGNSLTAEIQLTEEDVVFFHLISASLEGTSSTFAHVLQRKVELYNATLDDAITVTKSSSNTLIQDSFGWILS